MRLFPLLLILSSLLFCVHGRILFPEELVSFLSFVYSIIPPFKIGKDSRLGAGFRLGQNADFQVLIELGPQSETQPIGPDADSARDVRASHVAKPSNANNFQTIVRKILNNMPSEMNKNVTEDNLPKKMDKIK